MICGMNWSGIDDSITRVAFAAAPDCYVNTLPAAGFITWAPAPMSEDEDDCDIHNGHDSDDIIMPAEDKCCLQTHFLD